MSPRRVKAAETALYTGIKLKSLYDLVRKGKVPHYRFGVRDLVFDLDEIDSWMAAHHKVGG